MISIIDYGAGNIRNVEHALNHLGYECELTSDADAIRQSKRVILPGVGAFGAAMEALAERGLDQAIREAVADGKPFLGICLGLQLLFGESEESPGARGLDILPGRIRRIPAANGQKVPQIGWNSLSYPREGRLFRGVDEGTFVYFVHSYYLEADDQSIVTATCDYGVRVEASVERNNVFACQFHPEKSGACGLRILDNFCKL